MSIEAILSQPLINSINAAYRPVVLRVLAKATNDAARPPVVYCDMYFNNVFYKTLSKSQYDKINPGDSEWQFDIQDACQEYLKKYLGVYNLSTIQLADPVVLAARCRFRSSGIDANGFILPEGTAPVQGTGSNPPLSGTGLESDSFFVVNATLQNEDDQDLKNHLNSRKRGIWIEGIYPLTNRPNNYKVCPSDSDYYPIVNIQGTVSISQLRLNYKYLNASNYAVALSSIVMPAGTAYYIPNGPMNLLQHFGDIDFKNVDKYFIEGLAFDDTVLFTSTATVLSRCCADDKIRIVFVNYLGAIDAINFRLMTKEHQVKADAFERPLSYPLQRTEHAINRFYIKSNNTYTVVCTDYAETEMVWMNELFDSPAAWMETESGYVPIVILDANPQNVKQEERHTYQVQLQFKLSHEKITLRN